MSVRETADDIETAAARWVWRLDRAPEDARLRADLDAWLAPDPRRRGAFAKAQAAWALMDRAEHLRASPASEGLIRPLPRLSTRRAVLAGGGVALAASVGGLGLLLARTEQYRTGIGEVRRVPLQDGSLAAINTASKLEVVLQPKRRLIRLDDGEAWFQVAKDASRPFVVEAGRIRVQAIGTAFSVRRRAGGADVLVTEGVVKVWTMGAESRAVRLAAGDKAVVGDSPDVEAAAVAATEIDRKLAWRDGQIDLAGETLSEAAAEFNRYNVRKVIVEDPSLADRRLFGVFHTDEPEAFARAVEASLGAQADISDAQILISRKKIT